MNILDAALIARKSSIQTQATSVLALAPPIGMAKTVLSISEAIADVKSLSERRTLDNLASKVRILANAVVRGDQDVSFSIDPEEKSLIEGLIDTTKAGIRLVARAVAKGVSFVLRTVVKNLVVPLFRVVGAIVMECLPLIFNPVTLTIAGVGLLGYGAYRFYKRFSGPSAGAEAEIPMAPSAPAGAPTEVQPSATVPRLVAPASVIPGMGPEGPRLNKRVPQGIRNNNPGNLRFANQPGADPNSGAFAVFPSQNLGLFNLARQIGLHYYNRGKTTVRGLVQMWAPPNENNTTAYIASVSRQTGFAPDTPFDFEDVDSLKAVMRAIIVQENGMMPYSDAQLTEAAEAAQSLFASRGLSMPVSGTISSLFGHRVAPKQGASTEHMGIDIAAREGSPVVAAASGIVTFAGPKSGYGNTVDLKSGQLFTRYAHMRRTDVRTSDVVVKGQKIGEVGNTGVSTGPHLHFEVHPVVANGSMGDAEDPMPYLGQRPRGARTTAGLSGAVVVPKSIDPPESIRRGGRVVMLRS